MSEIRESGSDVSGSNEVASVVSLDEGEVVRAPVEPVENESNSVHSSPPDDSMDAASVSSSSSTRVSERSFIISDPDQFLGSVVGRKFDARVLLRKNLSITTRNMGSLLQQLFTILFELKFRALRVSLPHLFESANGGPTEVTPLTRGSELNGDFVTIKRAPSWTDFSPEEYALLTKLRDQGKTWGDYLAKRKCPCKLGLIPRPSSDTNFFVLKEPKAGVPFQSATGLSVGIEMVWQSTISCLCAYPLLPIELRQLDVTARPVTDPKGIFEMDSIIKETVIQSRFAAFFERYREHDGKDFSSWGHIVGSELWFCSTCQRSTLVGCADSTRKHAKRAHGIEVDGARNMDHYFKKQHTSRDGNFSLASALKVYCKRRLIEGAFRHTTLHLGRAIHLAKGKEVVDLEQEAVNQGTAVAVYKSSLLEVSV